MERDELHWYVAYVLNCCERRAGEFFDSLGYESYVPLRREVHRWSDRKKLVERVLLPHLIFVRTDENGRRRSLSLNPYITAYMSSHAPGSGIPFEPAVVRDGEMELFRAMVDGGDVSFEPGTLAPGDRVVITDGPFRGRECELVSLGKAKCIVSRLGCLGAAVVEVPPGVIKKL